MIINGNFKLSGAVEISGAPNYEDKYIVFARTRVVLTVTYATAFDLQIYKSNTQVAEITGIVPVNGTAQVDLTDIMRTLIGSSASVDIASSTTGDSIQYLSVVNGIYPSGWLLPRFEASCYGTLHNDGHGDENFMLPPLVMYAPKSGAVPLVFAVFGREWWQSYVATSGGTFYQYQISVTDFTTGLRVYNPINPSYLDLRFRPVLTTEPLAKVTYLARSGKDTICYWKYRRLKMSAIDTREIEVLSDGYQSQRGGEFEVELYLDGLDAYSYAYYADILQSPSVRVTIDSYEYEAEVTTKSVTLPDGNDGKLHELSVTAKLMRYDTI